jgi:hypothetical protein
MSKLRRLLLSVLCLLCFGAHAFAEESEGAVGACPECSNPDVKPIAAKLWWSVDPKDVDHAFCMNQTAPSETEMTDYLHTAIVTDPEQKETRTINGIDFQNENPELLALFQEFQRITDRSKKDQTPLQFHSKCHDVLCAMNEIYGKPQGTQIFYIYARYGLKTGTLTHNQQEYVAWKASELTELVKVLQVLPPDTFPFKRFERSILHSTISAKVENGEIVANSAIQILQPWFKLPANSRLSSVIHELGHDVAQENDLDLSYHWLQTTGWKVKGFRDNGQVITDGKPPVVPSPYGGTDPVEDFAETFAAYRLNPTYLKKRSPERYQYMKTVVFHGIEFTSEAACSEPFHNEENLIAQKQKTQQDLIAKRTADRKTVASFVHGLSLQPPVPLKPQQAADIFAHCLNQYLDEAAVGHQGQADSCLTEHIRRSVVLSSMNHITLDSALISVADLSKIPVSAAQKKQVRDLAKNYLSPIFYETYKSDEAIQLATTPKECQLSARYFYRSMSDSLKGAIPQNASDSDGPNNSVVQNIVARACQERIKAFGTSIIGQYNNPFAKNTFDQVFNF